MSILAMRRRRVAGASRRELVHAIAQRERRLKPVLLEIFRQVRAATPLADLRHGWTVGGQHPALELVSADVWKRARAKLVAALRAPIQRQDGPDDGPTADELADRLIGELIVDLSGKQRDAVRAQLAALMAHGPRPAILQGIADAAGLTPKQTQRVAALIADAIADGDGEDAALRQGRMLAGRLLDQRANVIARHEAVTYTSQLVLEHGRSQDGLVLKAWVSARDENVDEICLALDEQEPIPIDQPFRALGLDFDGPPAHIGCRCVPEIWTEEAA